MPLRCRLSPRHYDAVHVTLFDAILRFRHATPCRCHDADAASARAAKHG